MAQKPKLTPLGAALAGALGGCFSTAVVYPLDVAKTRIQALPADSKGKKKDNLSMLTVLLQIFKKEGFLGWYRGFGATMLNTFSQQYAYFFFYSFVRNSYINRLARKLPPGSNLPALSTAAELLMGAIAGALAQIFTIPVSVIATRQQVGRIERPKAAAPTDEEIAFSKNEEAAYSMDEKSSEDRDESFLAVAKEIVDEEGVTGLWLGIKPGLVLTVNPAITYGMFERVKSLLMLAKVKAGGNDKMSGGQTFLVGALSKTLATVVTYPYIMAKVRIQARSAHESPEGAPDEGLPQHMKTHGLPHHHVGALQILARVYKREGLVGWYQGMQAQITKAVISQALLFWSKDQFEQYALIIMLLLARMSRRS